MKRPRFLFPLLLIGFSPFYQPTFRLAAQCCGGGSGGGVVSLPGSMHSGYEKRLKGGCGTGTPTITVVNTGSDPLKVVFAGIEFDVPVGGKVTKQILIGAEPIAPGQTVNLQLQDPTGGSPPATTTADVSWTFPGKVDKGDCKKEEKNEGTAICESCGTDTQLQGGSKESSKIKCGSAKNNTQTPGKEAGPAGSTSGPDHVKDGQGSDAVCETPGQLYNDGVNDRMSAVKTTLPVYLGESTRPDWSAGVLVPTGNPAVVSNYTLQGADGSTWSCGVVGAPGTMSGWRTGKGAVTANQISATAGAEVAEFKFYLTSAYTDGGSNITITGNPHRDTLVTKRPPSASPNASLYTDGGISTRVRTYDQSTGTLLGESTVTVWSSGGADSLPGAAGTRTSLTINEEGGVVQQEQKTVTTVLSSPTRRKLEHQIWNGPSGGGAIATESDETYQLFPWGEELVEETSYPDGKVSGPIIRREYTWWNDIADPARHASLKLTLEKHSTVGSGTWVTGNWQATWPEADGSNTARVTLGPWQNGSLIPTPATTLTTLQSYASGAGNYTTEKTTSTGNGQWLKTVKMLGGTLVEQSEDIAASETLSEVKSYASASTTFITRTERVGDGDYYLQPTTQYELRAGQTDYTASGNLISKSSWHREKLYPDETTPGNVLLASQGEPTWWTGEPAPWEVEWSSRREFSESAPTGSDAETDRLIKTATLTDRQSGNVLAEKRFLSTTDASSADVFATGGSDVLLETKVWTYDSLARPLSMSINGIERESWSYASPSATTRSTTHIDGDGVETVETVDLQGRQVANLIKANGTAGQNDVTTTWTYGSRTAKSGQKVTQSVNGGGAWVRNTIREYDTLDRIKYSEDEAGVQLNYTHFVNASGEAEEKTILLSSPNVEQYSNTFFRDGQIKSRGGAAVVADSYSYAKAAYLLYKYRVVLGTTQSTTVTDGLGRIMSTSYPVSGTGSSTTMFTETRTYDALGRMSVRKVPVQTGNLYEVHTWSRTGTDAYAHDTALSTDTVFDNADASRKRIVSSYLLAAPYGGATSLWWRSTAVSAATGSGTWDTAARSRRTALQEVSMTINSVASQVPLTEDNAGGMRTITAENRNRGTFTVVHRSWKNSSTLFRSLTVKNGLPTTFTAPEQTAGLTLDYSPLREPLAEASFETYPYWPRRTLQPGTGRVDTTLMPRRAAGTEIQTGAYTYYPATSTNAGAVQSFTDSATGGVTYFDYNDRGQVTRQWGSGTYPQRNTYDTRGRITQLDTWRTVAGSGVDWTTATWPVSADTSGAGAKSSTAWAYIGITDLVYTKTYPDAGTGNRIVTYAYNLGGNLAQRTAQRGVTSIFSYDGYARPLWVNYSDTTPDVQYAYHAHSGRTSTVSEGSLSGTTFTTVRSTAYTHRYDGAVTGETLTDTAGATVTLGRGYDSMSRQNAFNQSWNQTPAGLLTAPAVGFNYDSTQRLSSVYASAGYANISAAISGLAASKSTTVTPTGSSSSVGNSATRDIYGRVTSLSNAAGSSALRWDRDRLMARGRSSSADRWEYRYNAKGEVTQAWKQFQASVGTTAVPNTAGEVQSGTGSVYGYDDIGNRTSRVEAGRATVGSGVLVPTDTRTTTYTPNILNQYTGVANPTFFNVRGTRAAGAAIVVNGDPVDSPTPTADSGYQEGGTGTYFRDEVPNTAPVGTSAPDLYEAVKVTTGGSAFTVDDPVQHVPPVAESLTYDLDGNLLTDGRWTYTWDAADRLIRMESAAWTQPATGSAIPAATVPAQLLEFGYDAFSRRIRKKVHTKAYGSGTWVLATWEAYVYDGWNMAGTYKLTAASAPAAYAGTVGGVVQSRFASYIWGPDIGSRLDARSNWQRGGGVGGLVMAVYSMSGGYLVPYIYDAHVPVYDHMGNITHAQRWNPSTNLAYPPPTEFVYDYDAFGKEIRSSSLVAGANPDSFPFHYSTKFTDGETGFNYYGYRFYDPGKGRWINRDPIEEQGGLNLYGMVYNDCLGRYDILGMGDSLDLALATAKSAKEAVAALENLALRASYECSKNAAKAELALKIAQAALDAAEKVVAEATAAEAAAEAAETAGSANETDGPSSKYELMQDKGGPKSVPNRKTDITKPDFEQALRDSGYTGKSSADGKVTEFTNGSGNKFVTRPSSKTNGPTADYTKPGEKSISLKIRLAD